MKPPSLPSFLQLGSPLSATTTTTSTTKSAPETTGRAPKTKTLSRPKWSSSSSSPSPSFPSTVAVSEDDIDTIIPTTTSSFFPSSSSTAKLFWTGATVGPIVDSLHNQCLLKYEVAPIHVPWPAFLEQQQSFFFLQSELLASSWTVPPLLGFAYVVLGGILPRVMQRVLNSVKAETKQEQNLVAVSQQRGSRGVKKISTVTAIQEQQQTAQQEKPKEVELRNKAIVAVVTTAMIIKLSEYLETHPENIITSHVVSTLLSQPATAAGTPDTAAGNILILLVCAILQWALLDGTVAAFLAASVTSIGGPLSELPFVGHHVWDYLPQSADYFPLAGLGGEESGFLSAVLGTSNIQSLGLSSITGPCYFAVTMDAIALGRWFDATSKTSTTTTAKPLQK